MIIKRKIVKASDLYFLSSLPSLDKEILHPRIPNNMLVNNKFEDWKTPRICLYPSVDKALTALSQNLSGKTLYVYQPVGIFRDSLVKPDISQVPDSIITDEYWYLRDLRVKFIAEIRVEGLIDNNLIYHYGPRSTIGKLSTWNWKEILKPWEKKGKL